MADEAGAVGGVYEDAPVLGAPGGVVGDADTAVVLDGVDDGVVFGDAHDLLGAVSFTVEVWVKPSMYGTEFPRVLDKEVFLPLRNGYTMFLREPEATDPNQSRHGFECWLEGEITIRVLPDVAPALDVWTHVVARMDGAAQQMRVFHDGVLIGAQDGSDCAMIDNAGVLRLGGNSGGGSRYAGGVDEVAIYDHALSDARILAHWQVGSGN
ncbi:MAG: LamG domain-containing protein [Polyangiaceae bacterium]